jgi:transglutaminase-like putative cysteine protease
MTKFRLSCKTPNRLKISLAASALALLLALAWFSPRAHASDSAPDWLRAAAAETLPTYPKDAVAVVLLDEEHTTVKDNGEIETMHRFAYKFLRPEARDDYGHAVVTFDNETKISYFRAWTIMPNGAQIEVKDKEASEVSLADYEVFSDERAKIIRFPEANVGSVVGYEYMQRQRPFVFEDDWWFQDKIPTRHARFFLQLPAGWDFTNFFANFPQQQPQASSNNQYVWEMQDVPAIDVEPNMPPFPVVAGRMDIKYFPRDQNLRAKTTGTWNDIGVWYSGLTASSRASSPALQQKVTELTAGLTDPVAQMKALASYMQRNIRYVAIEIGIGGFQPHNAADIFAHQYGDCKDKATLLSAMLKQIGIDSYYVLIDTDRGIVNPKFPSIHFDHAILAIRLPDKAADTGLYATLTDPKLGRLLFFDPTNPYVPLGYIPSYLQDNYALLVTPDGGQLVDLPLLPPSTNRLLRTAALSVSATGNLTGQVEELRWGGPAEQSRAEFLTSAPADRRKVIESFLGNSLTNFSLTSASIGNLEKYDESLTLTYKFAVDGYAKSAGDLLILRPRVVGAKGSSLLSGKVRKYPIEFTEATRQDDIFDITLPPGYVVDELPKPVDAECAYGTYKSQVLVANNVLHYKRTYEIKDVLVPTKNLDEVRDFFHQIAADERSSAVLRRATP